MLGVRFPAAFTHSIGTESESNVTCDVYADINGLQYWVYADNSGVAKRGDLLRIIYGASDRQLDRHSIPSQTQKRQGRP